MIKNVPRRINNPACIRSFGLPSSINNKAVNSVIQPMNKYRIATKTIKDIKLDN